MKHKPNSIFIEGLALLFIALKLTEEIDWSWVWVLSPIWISIIVTAVVSQLKINLDNTLNK
jgi:hypothetical protein